jgi:hypothetical protein
MKCGRSVVVVQIRYRVRPEEVDDNFEAVRAFMAELGRDPDDGFVTESFQLPDQTAKTPALER